MKIGIACTTYNRAAHLQEWTKRVAENSPQDAIFHIANDAQDRRGVAFRKTECIRELYSAGCDYLFVFDDDCFPVKSGWCHFFIDALMESGQNHFNYVHESPNVKLLRTEYLCPEGEKTFKGSTLQTPIGIYNNFQGCLLVMTRKAVDKVGGFNSEYKIYGGEHSDYSMRIFNAGLNPMGASLCPIGAEEFIYSCDLDNSRPEIQKKLKHKSAMSAREAIHHAQIGMEIYNKGVTKIHYPLNP